MRAPRIIGLGVLLANAAAAQSPPAAQLICTRGQQACAALVPLPVTRSLAAWERERAEHALQRQPMNWQVIYVLVPADDPQALDELNLLLLAQLSGHAATPTAPAAAK